MFISSFIQHRPVSCVLAGGDKDSEQGSDESRSHNHSVALLRPEPTLSNSGSKLLPLPLLGGPLNLNIVASRGGSPALKPPSGLKGFTFDQWKALLWAGHLGRRQSPGQAISIQGPQLGTFRGSVQQAGKTDVFIFLYFLLKFSMSFNLECRPNPIAVLAVHLLV